MTALGTYRDAHTLLAEHARRFPAKPFVESIHQGKAITFAEMNGLCNRVARFLADRGVRANDRIAILSENRLEALILFFGILRYGAAVNPLNVEESGYNLRQILQDVQPRFVFWHRQALADRADLVGDGRGVWIPFGDWDAQDPPEGDLFRVIRALPEDPVPGPVGGPGDIALVDFTSGTMATPKGILISHAAYHAMVQEVVDRFEIGETDRVLEYRAYSWESPQLLGIGSTLHTGATLVLAKHFSQSHFFEWLKKYQITVAAGVPTVLNMLLERPLPFRREEAPALRYITCSSAPLAREQEEAFERRYGIPVVQGMGMSEAGFMMGNSPRWRKPGSVGRPMRFTTLRFVDEAGRECGPGQEGEMMVSGGKLAVGYVAPQGEMRPLPQDGFPTGDMGYRDAEGFIFITGRKKDLIIRGGVNISPLEVAEALLQHPGVREAAAVGVPDPIYGEEVVGFVVCKEGTRATAEELLRHCATRLPEFKRPKVLLFVDAIPKTDRGKVSKQDLLAVWARTTSAPQSSSLSPQS
jgi:acyl-CoA synthetase (AMP-forming)/AMP-acid ligase II